METITLNGDWKLYQEDNPAPIPAVVPGCVHTDLLAAGEIPDPFYRDNELQVLWVGEEEWLYRRAFSVPEDFLQHDQVLLHCAGLDTLAAIRINGVEIGRTDNMFRIYEFDVRDHLKPGENEIEILFASAVLAGQELKLDPAWPFAWHQTKHYYFRPESGGLLFCACDHDPMAPADVGTDQARARTYVRANAIVDSVNSSMFFGDPFTVVVRDDLPPEEVQGLLTGPGILYVREDALKLFGFASDLILPVAAIVVIPASQLQERLVGFRAAVAGSVRDRF